MIIGMSSLIVFLSLNLLLSWWFLFKGIPARNSVIGFRTIRSTKNDENWIFANKKYAKYSGIISLIYFMILVGYLFYITYFNAAFNETAFLYGLYSFIILFFGAMIVIYIELVRFEKRKK